MKEEAVLLDIRHCSKSAKEAETVINFKGCPLKCVWCHSAIARSVKPELVFNDQNCRECYVCVTTCDHLVHQIDDQGHHIHQSACQLDGKCVRNCSFDALSIIGKKYHLDQLWHEIEDDLEVLSKSGGRITLSGGEPTSQLKYIIPLLKKLKEAGINTALDTNGYTRTENLQTLIPLVDLFLIDYKETDPFRHYEFTGVYNQLIISNIHFLMEQKQNVILVCPYIPGYNDHQQHLEGIASFCRQHPELKVKVLPHDPLHGYGSNSHDLADDFTQVKPPAAATLNEWKSKLAAAGCQLV